MEHDLISIDDALYHIDSNHRICRQPGKTEDVGCTASVQESSFGDTLLIWRKRYQMK